MAKALGWGRPRLAAAAVCMALTGCGPAHGQQPAQDPTLGNDAAKRTYSQPSNLPEGTSSEQSAPPAQTDSHATSVNPATSAREPSLVGRSRSTAGKSTTTADPPPQEGGTETAGSSDSEISSPSSVEAPRAAPRQQEIPGVNPQHCTLGGRCPVNDSSSNNRNLGKAVTPGAKLSSEPPSSDDSADGN